jgi:DNA-binding transcriptional MerR regulator
MWNVTELARSCGLSRGTVLYYESIGLLNPAARTASRYRQYGEREAARLRQIRIFRDAGLTLDDIRVLLDRRSDSDAASVLERRLQQLSAEIERLRGHQRSILALLKHKTRFRRSEVMTKDKWVSIMQASGFSEDDMHRWHAEFEKAAPEDHQEFLSYLKIPHEEIARIRDWSRSR